MNDYIVSHAAILIVSVIWVVFKFHVSSVATEIKELLLKYKEKDFSQKTS